MKKPSDYKNYLIVVSLVALFFVALSGYLFFRNKYQAHLAAIPTGKPIMTEVETSSSTKIAWALRETPVGTGSCIFIDQHPFVQTQNMVKKNDARSLGYAVELDASIATGTLVSVCKINGKDIQLIKESPYSKPESNWTLAVKEQSTTSSWKLVEFRDTLQSDFPGCEVRRLYNQDDGRFVAIKCSQITELGNVGRWEDYFLADMQKKTVKKYASCASNDLNLELDVSSLRDRFPLEDYIPSMRCSVASGASVISDKP